MTDSMDTIVSQLTRYVISTNQGNTIYSRAKLLQQIKNIQLSNSTNDRVKFDTVHKKVNDILHRLYGVDLIKLDDKNFILVKRDESSIVDTPVSVGEDIVENSIPNNFEINMNKILLQDSITEYKNNTSDISDFYSKNSDLMDDGILCVVLAIIIIKKNRILEEELKTDLKEFGIGTRSTKGFLDLDAFLNKLVKLDYITKDKEMYSIGRRTKLEMDIFSLTLLLKEVFSLSDDQLPQYESSIRLLVGDSYE